MSYVPNPASGQAQPIYQAEPEAVEVLKKCTEKLHHVCMKHLNRPVRVQTVHGQSHEGVIVHVDAQHLYLQINAEPARSYYRSLSPYGYGYGYPGYYPGYNPYYNTILPLALFNLLTISLLY